MATKKQQILLESLASLAPEEVEGVLSALDTQEQELEAAHEASEAEFESKRHDLQRRRAALQALAGKDSAPRRGRARGSKNKSKGKSKATRKAREENPDRPTTKNCIRWFLETAKEAQSPEQILEGAIKHGFETASDNPLNIIRQAIFKMVETGDLEVFASEDEEADKRARWYSLKE